MIGLLAPIFVLEVYGWQPMSKEEKRRDIFYDWRKP